MKATLGNAIVVLLLLLLCAPTPARAHRIDEYLQAATIDVGKDHLSLDLRLTPGVDVARTLLGVMDTDGNGVLSDAEQHAYADKVLGDLWLTIDGHDAPLRLRSLTFPQVAEMTEGRGEILLRFQADVPAGAATRKLKFRNYHQSLISVYLVNCLKPRDPDIHITAQDRTYNQSSYELQYVQAAANAASTTADPADRGRGSIDDAGSRSLFRAYVYQGIHHILTGYDHLLFVSALVLAATTLWDVVRVVFTFTVAHSITLALAAFNVIHLPAHVVEPMIAASIVFVALQNVFWPRRARGWTRLGAAFFFGLFHGLGFAGGLLDAMREMPGATMLLAILAFSVGVEVGHQMVVLPLFAFLKAARSTRSDAVTRTRLAMAFQRIGSAGISVAGLYYLCLAVTGNA